MSFSEFLATVPGIIMRPPCLHCGHLPGPNVLDKMPHQDLQVPRRLLRSSHFPTRAEYSTIQETISSSEDYIRILKAELLNLQEAIKGLRYGTERVHSRLMNICKFKDLQSSMLAPVRRLPDEILGEIFACVCQDPIDIEHGPGIYKLQKVCVWWRNLVRNMPSLWSRFQVYDYCYNRQAQRYAKLGALFVKTSLQFSRIAPLSVSFTKPGYESPSDWIVRAVEDMANHADRWEFIEIDIAILEQALSTTTMETSIARNGLSNLRSLIIMNERTSETNAIPFHVFRTATALENIKLCRVRLFGPSQFPQLTKVKRFTIKNCEVGLGGEFTSMLCAMPNLEHFTWMNNSIVQHSQPIPHIITLPRLHTLTVKNYYNVNMGSIWPMIRVPRLGMIKIVYDKDNLPHILSMVHASGRSIKQIHKDSHPQWLADGTLYRLEDIHNIEYELCLELEGSTTRASPAILSNHTS